MGEQLPELIRQMLQPSFYADEVTKNVELIQTHISYVLIGERYTYKIKKGLDLGFLDFRALEDRKYFCHEEIRLNSKLAPKLYIEAVPIYQKKEGAFTLTPTPHSEIVEYAVKMHSFNNDHLFSTLFEDGKLDESIFEKIGLKLAKHHNYNAKTDAEILKYGTPKSIENIINGNFSIVENYVDKTISSSLYQKLKTLSYNFLNDNEHLFEERVEEGKIKENHGDLHLKNICLYQNEVQIFDCIEFNEQFKNIDCIYDVAFLFMDLLFHQNIAYAYAFLNNYLEQSNDYEAVQLLPLYSSMRAFIRGKVISIETGDEHISESQKKESASIAHSYFQLAESFLEYGTGKIYVIFGMSGSGKSTLSKKLSRKIGAIHLRSDAIRKHITGTSLLERKNIYTEEISNKTYDTIEAHALQSVKFGYNIILDATYLSEKRRNELEDNLSNNRIKHTFIYCEANLEVMKERINHRKDDISDATVAVLLDQAKSFTTPNQKNQVTIDTTEPDHFKKLLSLL